MLIDLLCSIISILNRYTKIIDFNHNLLNDFLIKHINWYI